MNVALVWNGPADDAERGILVRRELTLLRLLRDEGVRATVLLLGDPTGFGDDVRAACVDVDVLPTALPPSAASVPRLPGVALALRQRLARLTPDVVEGDDVMPAIAVGLAARGRRRGVVVYRRHHESGRTRLHVASRLAARLADRTLVSSATMRRRAAADDHVSVDRVDVAGSGAVERPAVSPADACAARRSLGIGDAARVIGVVSRLRWEKGLDVLLAALDHLQLPNGVHVVVVGTGPEDAALRARAAQCPAPVHFLGHRNDVERWMAVADVVALPSRRESLGRVTLEAMAAARPIVASRVGGLTEAVVDGETGLLVPPDDPPALADALRRVLGDDALAHRLGAAARARYEARYTIAHMAGAWRAAWERALTGAPVAGAPVAGAPVAGA